MAVLKTANLGRGVGLKEFLRNVIKVLGGMRAIIGLQEIDEADGPKEHKAIWNLAKGPYRRVGWKTKVPILVPRAIWKVVNANVIPASAGVPRQSPARVITWARCQRRGRRNRGKIINVFNTHFPRKHKSLVKEREDVMRVLTDLVAQAYKRGEPSLITTDANGMDMKRVHPNAQRIGGRGIDWIVAVPHPKGTKIEVKGRFTQDLTIDGHDCHGVRFQVHSR